jgi:hypothetical protein
MEQSAEGLISPVTMMRTSLFLFVTAMLVAPVASAQTEPADAEAQSCPRGRTSIYYASGEATPSEEAQSLIQRVSDNASACQPDGIDLVTRIDTRVDGDKAVSLALQRLGSVAEDLVARGFPSDRIRVAAQAANEFAPPGLGEVEVIFRKAKEAADDVAAPPTTAAPARGAPDSI